MSAVTRLYQWPHLAWVLELVEERKWPNDIPNSLGDEFGSIWSKHLCPLFSCNMVTIISCLPKNLLLTNWVALSNLHATLKFKSPPLCIKVEVEHLHTKKDILLARSYMCNVHVWMFGQIKLVYTLRLERYLHPISRTRLLFSLCKSSLPTWNVHVQHLHT